MQISRAEKGLDKYGLIAVNDKGEATQVNSVCAMHIFV